MRSIYLFIAILFCGSIALAQVPQTLNYQGLLTDGDGGAVPTGDYELEFRLYDVSAGGSPLWSETQTVRVTQGIVNAVLGNTTPIDIVFDRQMYIGISVDGAPELSPRIQLTAAPYALGAASVQEDALVRSLNGVQGDLHIAAEDEVTVTGSGDTIRIGVDLPDRTSLLTPQGEPVVVVDTAGRVGIGGHEPEFDLDVQDDHQNVWMRFKSPWGTRMIFTSHDTAIGAPPEHMSLFSNGSYLAIGNANPERDWLPGEDSLVYIRDNGNLGVGSYPTNNLRLYVRGFRNEDHDLANGNIGLVRFTEIDDQGTLRTMNMDGDEIRSFSRDTTGGPTLKLQHSFSGFFRGNVDLVHGTLFVSRSNSVGINTRDPQEALHVDGNARVNDDAQVGGSMQIGNDASVGGNIQIDGDADIDGELRVGNRRLPVAYGTTKTVGSGSRNWTAQGIAGGWNIDITGFSYNEAKHTVIATPQVNEPVFVSVISVEVSGKKFIGIRTFDSDGKPTQENVAFSVYTE